MSIIPNSHPSLTSPPPLQSPLHLVFIFSDENTDTEHDYYTKGRAPKGCISGSYSLV